MSELFQNGDIHRLIVKVEKQCVEMEEIISDIKEIKEYIREYEHRVSKLEQGMARVNVWVGIMSTFSSALLVYIIQQILR